jgi:uncharacterized protein (DUF433 family)
MLKGIRWGGIMSPKVEVGGGDANMAKDRKPLLDRIIRDPNIMVGKPVVRDTRIPVEVVLGKLAENPDLDDLFGAYPRLTLDDVKACLSYAQSLVGKSGRQRPPVALRDVPAPV